ncbi:MAG: lytic transglycosylase domain-containing protein [Bacteroidota bacterium]|nr:lytic transglycosylase domain-containing protein [Bacteroidota bacterium]
METNMYDEYFKIYGTEQAIDWRLLKAQVKAESSFNPFATSRSGACGLAQFLPSTWKEWGHGSIHDPEESIKAQSRYMAHLMPLVNNKIELALASYNWGIGNIQYLISDLHSDDLTVLKTDSRFPKETRIYIDKVLGYYEDYKTHGKGIDE